jgi:hypothetical protein
MPTIHKRYGTKQNAKTWANQFKARILEPGIVSYEDSGCGKALLKKETIDQCVRSFIGRPLILTRDGMNRPTYTHAAVSPRTMEQMAMGYISDVQYDMSDGWWYAVGTVHDEDAKKAIKEIGLVSCAYDVLDVAPGGSHHNIQYQEEITAFEGEHLAIVANPRYERATIRLNAKTATKPIKHMFKWIKKAIDSVKNDVAQNGELPEGAALEVDGKPVPVADLVSTHKRVNSAEGEDLDGSSEIDIGNGVKVTIDQMIASHQKLNAMEDEEKKKNAADEEKKKEEEAKKNAMDEDEKKKENEAKEKEEEEKKNKKNSISPRTYKVNTKPGIISEARENGITVETTGNEPDTMENRLSRGNERYGPKKAAK